MGLLSDSPNKAREFLCCPICHSKIFKSNNSYVCRSSECNAKFPVVNEVPILIDENNSIFSINEIISSVISSNGNNEALTAKTIIKKYIPSISINAVAKNNYRKMAEILLKKTNSPRVLVVGGSLLGKGMESIVENKAFEMVETDVCFGKRTTIICDAHDIPFENSSFDGVIVQAVLEHVVDPVRCCEEIHRVLKENGVVYAETPFMQQVHGRQFDFTRFTHLGHRRLFRKFEEIDSGVACGPGMALAWSYQHFLLSFSDSKFLRAVLGAVSSLTSFFLKYFDYYLVKKRGALDAASGYYFMGRKSDVILSDKELIKLYRGAK